MSQENLIQNLILQRYENPHENDICACNNGLCLVKCRWDGCYQYPTSCEECFVKYHRHNPFHWALVWDTKKKVWNKRDYSEVIEGNFIQIGHVGEDKACSGSSPINFKITHTNGVHSTRVNFCGCPDRPVRPTDRLE